MASTLEYAKLSQAVYNGEDVQGWRTVARPSPELQQSGFYGAAYQNVATGEIVIAYRGTEPWSDLFKDLLTTDGKIAAGAEDQQFVDALAFAKNVQDTYQGLGNEISVTGHSLGGGLAQLAADTFGWDGVTFEAPGMGHGGPVPGAIPEVIDG
ncbi:MAG TPA: hypothetical protein VKA48_01105 [Gammaproteobacteria bacterium]|nr:hypothetical protein [Gammaproteobacteria bacterium]